jgi:hypothetical protein
MIVITAGQAREIYTKVPSLSTRETLGSLREWLDDDGASGASDREPPHP